jgi:molecular chaperone DnaK
MKQYVGIDLGTTNSAISTFDGENVKLYKSPEQNDVTPSAIFIDRRGNKYVGQRAYDNAARNPNNSAVLFKRLIGTSTPIKLSAVDITMTPEECSAEILKVLYSYLPEGIRNDPDTGAVITVPAAFNQMQKDATLSAAQAAGMGKIALMQEPVAAVMSVMRHRKGDGTFLVYDLGGGTLDIAIAESISGRVSLLAHGGIAMCGGRDFDRIILDQIVKPWLLANFDLGDDFTADSKYATLRYMATWASEKAKIELSTKQEAIISLDDSEIRVQDRSGKDIYVDIPISRSDFDNLVAEKINESIQATRETMQKVGLTPHDVGRIVFVGGPTQYKPLRDKVAFELGIAASTDVNPMTAVAEGAAVFAESIDWSSHNRSRKAGRGEISAGANLNISFAYVARTPDSRAKVVAKLGGKALEGAAFQLDSLDTGWSSGRVTLKNGASIEVPLAKPGENVFKIFLLDSAGGPITLPQDKIVISRTAAQIDAIPASHSIGVEAREKLGGRFILDYLVREGESLPKKGQRTFKSDESLTAGAPSSIKFKLWEGGIEDPVSDNRFIGMFEIRGSDFSEGVIAKGSDLIVDYEVHDSGNIVMEVTVPSISNSFESGRNFYSRQTGQIDYSNAAKMISEEAQRISERVSEVSAKVVDTRLQQAKDRISSTQTNASNFTDPESAKKAMDDLQEAKKLLAETRKDNLKTIRQLDLDGVTKFFDDNVREFSKPNEITSFDNLVSTAKRVISSPSGDFESHLRELRGKLYEILWRQDWFVIDRFNNLADSPHLFTEASQFEELIRLGKKATNENDIEKLRQIVSTLQSSKVSWGGEEHLLTSSNILIG